MPTLTEISFASSIDFSTRDFNMSETTTTFILDAKSAESKSVSLAKSSPTNKSPKNDVKPAVLPLPARSRSLFVPGTSAAAVPNENDAPNAEESQNQAAPQQGGFAKKKLLRLKNVTIDTSHSSLDEAPASPCVNPVNVAVPASPANRRTSILLSADKKQSDFKLDSPSPKSPLFARRASRKQSCNAGIIMADSPVLCGASSSLAHVVTTAESLESSNNGSTATRSPTGLSLPPQFAFSAHHQMNSAITDYEADDCPSPLILEHSKGIRNMEYDSAYTSTEKRLLAARRISVADPSQSSD